MVDTFLVYPGTVGPAGEPVAPEPVLAVADLVAGGRQVRLGLGSIPFGFQGPAHRVSVRTIGRNLSCASEGRRRQTHVAGEAVNPQSVPIFMVVPFGRRFLVTALESGRLEAGVFMARDYIERRETGFYIVGSRVPIDRIVWEYRNGEDPEAIQSHYPTLSLDQVNGAVTFYLNHRDEVEQVMEERKRAEDAYIAAHPTPPDIKEKFERMRRQTASRRS